MPIGAIVAVLVVAIPALLAVLPPRVRHASPWNLRFAATYLINEQPVLASAWLVLAVIPAIVGGGLEPWGLAVLLVSSGVAIASLFVIVVRAAQADTALLTALDAGFGSVRDRAAGVTPSRPPWLRILVAPFVSWRRDVRRIRNIRYADDDRSQQLDVLVATRTPQNAPVMIYLHGGAFGAGTRRLGAIPLLSFLAAHGWVCITADYRRQPVATYVDQLADVDRVIAWARRMGPGYGADPSTIFLCGSSAGAHLATMAALRTASDPERGAVEVAGVVALYGYYGTADARSPERSSLEGAISPDAPPVFVVHGSSDTLVPARDARGIATALRRVSRRPVVYAELPGAQHTFDLFHSIRVHAVSRAVEDFRARVVGSPA